MSEMISPMVNELNEAIEELEVYNFITRDIGLQKTASQKLALLLERVKKLKQEASERLDEDAANTLLGYECAISFLIASISMWVLLKEGKADEAWDRLVDSQQFVVDAIRSHRGFAHMQIYGQRLATLESLIFPPQTFLSVGMIVRKRLCSICGEEYGECNHLVGHPYMGQLCRTMVTEIEHMDHVAVVSSPANKRARVIEFDVPGGRRNKMTWKITSEATSEQPSEGNREGITVSAIIASERSFD